MPPITQISDSVPATESLNASGADARISSPLAEVGIHTLRPWLLAVLLISLCFLPVIAKLVRFAAHSDLYSYTLLIPFVSAYLIKSMLKCRALGRAALHSDQGAELPPRKSTAIPLSVISIFSLVLGMVLLRLATSGTFALQNALALSTFVFISLITAAAFALLPDGVFRSLRFPIAFLFFLIPFPLPLEHWIAAALQRGSAEVAALFFSATALPFLRTGMQFQLPGITIQVAPECSGIHSTLVLFITSIIGGWVLLNRLSLRVLLTAAVIPLALVRNAFRIWVLGELCVNVDPKWINSQLHHSGGPIFFVLSLIPFFLLLLFLRKWEIKRLEQAQGVQSVS